MEVDQEIRFAEVKSNDKKEGQRNWNRCPIRGVYHRE
jgi:hypothetical protein